MNKFEFLFCDFQTAVVPHVSLDIHHVDFGKLLDPNAVEQKVTTVKQFLDYLSPKKITYVICSGICINDHLGFIYRLRSKNHLLQHN